MSAEFVLKPCAGCGAETVFQLHGAVQFQTVHGDATINATADLCEQCTSDVANSPSRAAEIIRNILATPAKTHEQIIAEKTKREIDHFLTCAYQADTEREASEALASVLVRIFGEEHYAAAGAVAGQLLLMILRGLSFEAVGSVPGRAISAAAGWCDDEGVPL